MKNSIIAFLVGALAALLLYLKKKNPDIVNVSGDLIEEQKIKDNRKIKHNKWGLVPKFIYDDFGPVSVMIDADMSRREVVKLWKSLKNK